MKLHKISHADSSNIESVQYLEEILNQIDVDFKLTKKINSQLHGLRKKLKALSGVSFYKRYYLAFLRKDTFNNIKRCQYPIEVETNLLNIVNAVIRNTINEIHS